MSKTINLRKGLDIRLAGAAEKTVQEVPVAGIFAIQPGDFAGLQPKLLVSEGDRVEAGGAVLFDKRDPRIQITSPVSGVVRAIVRGEKRAILRVEVAADTTQVYRTFEKADLHSRDRIVSLLLEAGLWPMFTQRPYGVIASPDDEPRAIFVSAFDSAPLAADYSFVLEHEHTHLQKGFDVLKHLAPKVFLGVRDASFDFLHGIELQRFNGPHPAGNVGVQLHHTIAVSKDARVWTLNIADVAVIGRLFAEGRVDMTRVIAVGGSEVTAPAYYKVCAGMSLDTLLDSKLRHSRVLAVGAPRVIEGSVLSGRISSGFLGYHTHYLSVIPEGNHQELLGWAMPRLGKFSVSKTYFSWLFPRRKYNLDTNLNGGHRAFVVTGLYEKYLPMDIYPMHLLKACMAGDIDRMEQLGIYEVIEEDIALCEFVDPSKTEMQAALREGINLMIREA